MGISKARLAEVERRCKEVLIKRGIQPWKGSSSSPEKNAKTRHCALTGLGANCEFEDQTESLLRDAFIQIMNNKTVQERLCTESKADPMGAFRFAIAFEEGVRQQRNYEGTAIKSEPVLAINEKGKNPCTRCRAEFNTNHPAIYKTKSEQCRNCGITGHFERMCKRTITRPLQYAIRRGSRNRPKPDFFGKN